MRTATDRLEFAPPPTPGLMRSLGLAVVAHAVLLAALTLGVQWKRDDVTLTAEAEIWSAVPQQAAPKLEEVPTEPAPPAPETPPPTPAPEPAPPRPVPPPIAQVQPPAAPEVDIALEQEKARLKKLKDDQLKEQKLAQEKLALDKRRQEQVRQDKLKQDQLKLDKLKQDKLLAEQKREQDKRLQDQRAREKLALEKREQDKRDKEKSVALEKKKTETEAQRKADAATAQLEAKQLEAQRQANLQRMAGLAGSTGAPGATGGALQSSGPSASYAGRIRASIKPNIVFADDVSGNPVAEVEVRTSSDGTIISRKLTKPSGVDSWDEAVLKAIDKTGKLPKDVDGRVPQSLEIRFRPKD